MTPQLVLNWPYWATTKPQCHEMQTILGDKAAANLLLATTSGCF